MHTITPNEYDVVASMTQNKTPNDMGNAVEMFIYLEGMLLHAMNMMMVHQNSRDVVHYIYII